MLSFILATILLLSPFSYASKNNSAQTVQKSKCKVLNGRFIFEISNKDLSESERMGRLSIRKSKAPALVDEVPKGVAFAKTTYPSICEQTAAAHLGQGKIVLVYQVDEDSGLVSYSTLVYDFGKHKILDRIALGYLNNLKIIKNRVLYNAKEDVDMMGGRFNSKGKEFSYVSDDLSPWYEIKLSKDKVETDLQLDLTWKQSKWKEYFKDQNDFLKATGWSKKNKKFGKRVVYLASTEGESCIYLSNVSGAIMDGSEKWRCIQK